MYIYIRLDNSILQTENVLFYSIELFNVSRNSCDNNWILILDSCYYLSTTPAVQWKEAQRKCNELGANLLTLESLDELVCDIQVSK